MQVIFVIIESEILQFLTIIGFSWKIEENPNIFTFCEGNFGTSI